MELRTFKFAATLLIGCVLLCMQSVSVALERAKLNIDDLQGAGWQAQQISMVLQLDRQPLRAQLKIGRATLVGLQEPLRDLTIDCGKVQLLVEQFICPQARITGRFPYLGSQHFSGSARYTRSSGAIALNLQGLQLASGRVDVQAQLQEAGWQGQVELNAADIAGLLKLAQQFIKGIDLSGSGSLNARIKAQGRGTQVDQIDWQLQTHATLNNSAGTLASDTLAVETSGQAQFIKQGWQFDVRLDAPSGQTYAEPVFVDLGKYPLKLHARGHWDGTQTVQLQLLNVDQHDIFSGNAVGQLQLNAANPAPLLRVQIETLQFPGSFATYLQPFLLDSSFKNLSTNGSLQGTLQVQDTAPLSADLQLHALHADDGAQLRLNQLNGELHWRKTLQDEQHPPRSSVSWQSGNLLGFELGATQLQLELWDTHARIAEPTRIPIFNGALAIDAFRIRKLGTPQVAFMLDATIEPISVAQISKAFGWPEFGGELSGKITKLRMEDGVLTLGATLNAQVFGGQASISDMKLEGALTQWPRFYANIAFQRLDLEPVTQAFSFGRITGRLSGEINRLEMFNWQPVAFDAHLYTPADDRSKHRISQRAVQNIGSVAGSGGGVSAALQSGFLKFFDDFNYDELGISCQLTNEICLMNGVAPAKNGGYYLVKGRGLPRIDVIGNATRVDWPRLVAQLLAVTASEGPVVK